jgi:hypothetical protein
MGPFLTPFSKKILELHAHHDWLPMPFMHWKADADGDDLLTQAERMSWASGSALQRLWGGIPPQPIWRTYAESDFHNAGLALDLPATARYAVNSSVRIRISPQLNIAV